MLSASSTLGRWRSWRLTCAIMSVAVRSGPCIPLLFCLACVCKQCSAADRQSGTVQPVPVESKVGTGIAAEHPSHNGACVLVSLWCLTCRLIYIMNSSECAICYSRYDSSLRVPKNLPCGHVKCLQCLKQSQLLAQQTNRTFKCPECNARITVQPEDLTTNYTILQEASGVANQYHCDTCNKVADWDCEKNGHTFRGLWAHRAQLTASSRKAVEAWSNALERVVPKVLQLKDVAEEQLHDAVDAQSKAGRLTQRLSAFINGTAGPGADQEGAMRDAGECSLRLPQLERGLKFLELDKGVCRLQVQDGGEVWAANLNLSNADDAANVKPEILSVAQYLMYLLCKEGHLQKQEKPAKTPKPNVVSSRPSVPAASGQGLNQQQQGTILQGLQGLNLQGQNRQGQNRQGQNRQGQDRQAQPETRPSWTITDEGELDLRQGEKLGQNEKEAILRSTKMVTRLIVTKCNEDPDFYTKIILKHAPYIETLELRQVHQQHLNTLGAMRMLKDLKLVGYVGRVSVNMSPQPGCVLRSLYVKLPTNIQFELWEAYAASLSNIQLRIELSTLNIHNRVRTVAAKTPNLRHLMLSRYDEHTAEGCAVQLAAVRQVLSPTVNVKCSICHHGQQA